MSEFNKNVHGNFLDAYSSYSWVSAILYNLFLCYFPYEKKGNAIKSWKPNNFDKNGKSLHSTPLPAKLSHDKVWKSMLENYFIFIFFSFWQMMDYASLFRVVLENCLCYLVDEVFLDFYQ